MAVAAGTSKTGLYGEDDNTKEFLKAFESEHSTAGKQAACYIDIGIVLHRSEQVLGTSTLKKTEKTAPGTDIDRERTARIKSQTSIAKKKMKTIYETYLSSTEKQNSLVGVRRTSTRAGDREME
eukprot:17621_1